MQSIQIEKEGKYTGLLVRPEKGAYLSKENLETLLLHIKRIYQTDIKIHTEIINNLEINKEGFYCKEKNSFLDDIVENLRKYITEKVIVPQVMGSGPMIRHRVFYFGVSDDHQIEVKYTTIGEFNSIDIALKHIANLPPISEPT